MLPLDIFGFKALWSPYFLLILVALTIGYFLMTIPFRSKFRDSEPLTVKQAAMFLTGMILLYAIKGSPLDLMGHLMFYVHGISMVIFVLLIPPLFILSIPQWLWRSVVELKIINSLFRLFTKPVIGILLFNGFFSFYHIPIIFDHVMQNRFYHGGYSILLFVLAVFMWWSLISPLPEYQPLSGIKKVAFLFANSMLITPACALIIFSDVSLYATYHDPKVWGQVMSLCVGPSVFSNLNLSGPELFSSMSLVDDQRLGGVVMKIIQEIIYAVVLAQVFFEWYRKDQEDSEREMKKQMLNPHFVE
ncbi:cytochrome c oxidase assembly factor CtaG [Neobacillus sp. OS1-2]|uniref:cytochrome c oxidase assembly factor CtaG n=1 Tax=Neobacillus sp. OS1-2 TaxID=3070680 RepID=UPI0027DEFD09|nr:cytochrome c oxidase assembly factor CtaG [Neobacillus sp. OS1-2]WML38969.1 cytochrome c oxidase assembly factor CtaG [Neobacillus sp. OS1-2]